MMPNPRVGTVTMDIANAVKGAKGGSVEFRVEKAGIVQAGVGKASFPAEKLAENVRAFVDAVNKAKPRGRQGPLHQPHLAVLDHGAGREGRHGDGRHRGCGKVDAKHATRKRKVPGSRPGLFLWRLTAP